MTMTIEQQIDAIYALRKRREKIVTLYDDQIAELTAALEGYMRAAKVERARGEKAQAFTRTVQEVKVEDWTKVYRFIEVHHAFDLLQRRITPSAALERVAAGEKIPGLALGAHTEFVIRALPKKGSKDESDTK